MSLDADPRNNPAWAVAMAVQKFEHAREIGAARRAAKSARTKSAKASGRAHLRRLMSEWESDGSIYDQKKNIDWKSIQKRLKPHLAVHHSQDPKIKGGLITQLLVAAKKTFAPGLPPAVHEQREKCLMKLLDGVHAEDFGFPERVPLNPKFERQGRRSPLMSCRVYADEHICMQLFCVPPGGRIPLHTHPNMTVYSRILFGHARYADCDLDLTDTKKMTDIYGQSVQAPKIKFVGDHDLVGPCTHILLPDKGNLHDITASSPEGMAFFDIISPPYSKTDSPPRCCDFYEPTLDGYAMKVKRCPDGSGISPSLNRSFWSDFVLLYEPYLGVLPSQKIYEATDVSLTMAEKHLVKQKGSWNTTRNGHSAIPQPPMLFPKRSSHS